MSPYRSRPALRWLVPAAAAVLVVGGGAAAGTIAANAEPSLPARSAAQLLADVQGAQVDGLSGTVVQRSDLGLPALPGLTGGPSGDDLTRLLSGSNTLRVWYAGPERSRLALLNTLGETDVIRNGDQAWIWRSRDNTATRVQIPKDAAGEPGQAPHGLPAATPQEAAATALAAIDPTTTVRTSGSAKVAGRPAYELTLAPRDSASLIGQVRLAIDAKEHVPLRVEVYPRSADQPAVRVAFEQVSFTVPDAEQFVFNPPPGAKVQTSNLADAVRGRHVPTAGAPGAPPTGAKPGPAGAKPGPAGATPDRTASTVVGKGWTSVLVTKAPAELTGASAQPGGTAQPGAGDNGAAQLDAVLGKLPKVSGAWGSGRLLTGKLFSALLTDDGRVLLGAVAPEKLYEVAATKAGT